MEGLPLREQLVEVDLDGWTHWTVALQSEPQLSGWWKRALRVEDVPQASGIYELGLQGTQNRKSCVDTSTVHAVYVGSTGNLYHRISSYIRDGDHIHRLLDKHLQVRLNLCARWAKTSSKEEAKWCERILLGRFDYAFNSALNGGRGDRQVHSKTSTVCTPVFLYEIARMQMIQQLSEKAKQFVKGFESFDAQERIEIIHVLHATIVGALFECTFHLQN